MIPGTHHAAELTFTFGWPLFDLEDNEEAYSHAQINLRNGTEVEATPTDGTVSEFMMTLWTNFAKFGYVIDTCLRIYMMSSGENLANFLYIMET